MRVPELSMTPADPVNTRRSDAYLQPTQAESLFEVIRAWAGVHIASQVAHAISRSGGSINIQQVYDMLVNRGIRPAQAAAIVSTVNNPKGVYSFSELGKSAKKGNLKTLSKKFIDKIWKQARAAARTKSQRDIFFSTGDKCWDLWRAKKYQDAVIEAMDLVERVMGVRPKLPDNLKPFFMTKAEKAKEAEKDTRAKAKARAKVQAEAEAAKKAKQKAKAKAKAKAEAEATKKAKQKAKAAARKTAQKEKQAVKKAAAQEEAPDIPWVLPEQDLLEETVIEDGWTYPLDVPYYDPETGLEISEETAVTQAVEESENADMESDADVDLFETPSKSFLPFALLAGAGVLSYFLFFKKEK